MTEKVRIPRTRKRRIDALSLEELTQFRRACLENARELVEEAQLLLDTGHESGAYGLAHHAHEELAKWGVLLGVSGQIVRKDPINWEAVWNQLYHHVFKTGTAQLGIQLNRISCRGCRSS